VLVDPGTTETAVDVHSGNARRHPVGGGPWENQPGKERNDSQNNKKKENNKVGGREDERKSIGGTQSRCKGRRGNGPIHGLLWGSFLLEKGGVPAFYVKLSPDTKAANAKIEKGLGARRAPSKGANRRTRPGPSYRCRNGNPGEGSRPWGGRGRRWGGLGGDGGDACLEGFGILVIRATKKRPDRTLS